LSRAKPSFAVIRLAHVAISRDALTEVLGIDLDNFSLERGGTLHYDQVNVSASDDLWPAVGDMLSQLGPLIAALIAEQKIGRATLDLGFFFSSELVTRSSFIPSHIALVAGQSHIDVEVSTYPSNAAPGGKNLPDKL
jgi:hypothetical protein